MGKYEPLKHFLTETSSDTIDADFAEVEKILGFSLPQSAYRHQAWWANEAHGSHSHARSWQEAGWETSRVDLASRKVRFHRRRRGPSGGGGQPKPTGPDGDLWDRARRLSGIEDRDALLEAALTAFVHREASRRMAEMGGTMPDFEVPPRERPDW